MNEQWKPIPGFSGYEVSSFGGVRFLGTHTGKRYRRPFSPVQSKLGFIELLVVNLNLGVNVGLKKTFTVSHLVASAFMENPHGFNNINHIDGDLSNCKVANLEWVFKSVAMEIAAKWGRGRRNTSSRFVGVSFIWNSQRWCAGTKAGGEAVRIGSSYKTELEAAEAYNEYVIENNLYAPLNDLS